MTSDDILSMLKAVEQVIEDQRVMEAHISDSTRESAVPPGYQLSNLRRSVTTLATVQRDLLKSILEP